MIHTPFHIRHIHKSENFPLKHILHLGWQTEIILKILLFPCHIVFSGMVKNGNDFQKLEHFPYFFGGDERSLRPYFYRIISLKGMWQSLFFINKWPQHNKLTNSIRNFYSSSFVCKRHEKKPAIHSNILLRNDVIYI